MVPERVEFGVRERASNKVEREVEVRLCLSVLFDLWKSSIMGTNQRKVRKGQADQLIDEFDM